MTPPSTNVPTENVHDRPPQHPNHAEPRTVPSTQREISSPLTVGTITSEDEVEHYLLDGGYEDEAI